MKIKGYRLHKERIKFTSGTTIRSIKLPIKEFSLNEDKKELILKIKKQVKNDDLLLKGDVNLNDYAQKGFRGNPSYNFFDFWVDSLRAGVIWKKTTNELIDFVNGKLSKKDIIGEILIKASDKFLKYFDIANQDLKNFFKLSEVRANKNKQSLSRSLVSYLKQDYKKKKDKYDYEIINSDAQNLINFIVNSFFDNQSLLKLKGPQKQNQFWLKNFGIDKTKLKQFRPQGELGNISFVIVPQLISIDKDINIVDLIEKRIHFLERLNLNNDNEIKSILGLENNFSALSNYLGIIFKKLYQGEIEEIFQALVFIYKDLEDYKNVAFKSLNFLKEKAKLLSPEPSLEFISNWADYRSLLGGKIESWLSNYLRRKKEINQQINDFFNGLDLTKKFLIENKNYKKELKDNDLDSILKIIKEINQFGNKDLNNKKNYEIFDSFLSILKSDLNLFYQKYLIDEKNEIKVDEFSPFEAIYKKIYKPVSFYGEIKRENNDKNLRLVLPIIKTGLEFSKLMINELTENFSFNDDDDAEIFFRKLLNFYHQKILTKSINSNDFKNFFIDILVHYISEEDKKNIFKKNRVFYKSDYSKGTQSLFKLINTEFSQEFKKLIFKIKDFLASFENDYILINKDLLLDWIETFKNLSSILIKFSINNDFDSKIFEPLLKNYLKIKIYYDVFNPPDFDKNLFTKLWQQFFLSEFKGAAILYSKKTYLARYVSQFIGSENKIKIFFYSSNQDLLEKINDFENIDNDVSKNLVNKRKYLISFDENLKLSTKRKLETDVCLIKLSKNLNQFKKVYIKKESFDNLFEITSSYYQLQFLDRLFYKPKDWRNVDIKLSEWNLILEQDYEINWKLEANKAEFIKKENSKKNKLYINIPFEISSKNLVIKFKQLDNNRFAYPICGIDVGEYGLAYCLIKVGGNQTNIIDKGFFEDKNIANIKDKFAKIQERSRKGIFNETDSTIVQVRENAIGALRNQIHDLVVKYNASPVYEYSISNFETGSGRTTKIYNSVKRSDVFEEGSEVSVFLKTQIWGIKKTIGRNVSSYASSYTCINCKRSLYELNFQKKHLENGEVIIVVQKRQGNIIYFQINNNLIICGYSDKNKFVNNYQLKTRQDLDDFNKALKDFTRPPVKSNSEVLVKFANDLTMKKLKKEDKELSFIDVFRKRRGNSSIFVCPFDDCHFVADADIQAAFIMAIRGYIKFLKGANNNNQNNDKNRQKIDYFKETLIFLKKLQLQEDIFYPSID